MSGPANQILTTAPGTTEQLSGQHNPTNSGSGNSQKSTGRSVVEIPEEFLSETNSESGKSRRSPLLSVLEKLRLSLPDIKVTSVLENLRHSLPDIKASSVLEKLRHSLPDIKVFLDPMLLYVFLSGDYDERSISFDKIFGLTISAINIFLEFADQFPFRRLRHCNGLPDIKGVLLPHGLPKNRIKRLITFYNVFLQIPSSVVLVILFLVPRTMSIFLFMLVLICLRCLKSLFQMHKWYRTSRTSAKSYAWFMMFLIFYAAFSHLLGVLWYIQALFKEDDCWNEAYDKHNEIGIDNIGKYCSRNTSSFDFGIYRDAHQSGIVDMTSFAPKILYCFRWALQNLSSFGQGLQPDGANVLENIFVIIIIFASVFLFSFTIGKVQIFLQYNIKRNEMIEKKMHEIEQWLPFQKLPQDLQSEVKSYYKKIWYASKGHNEKHLFSDLPQYLREKIIPELCKDLLKNVEEFRRWSEQTSKVNEASLADLCECVKLVSYEEDTNIIRKGDPIDKAIFVLQGTLWIYTPTDGTTSGSPSDDSSNQRNDLLIYGNFCGQELISQLQAKPYTLNLRVSDRSIQAVTKVEAFVLRAYDLKNIFIKRHEAILASLQATNTGNPPPSQP